jgi:hypothetical protein
MGSGTVGLATHHNVCPAPGASGGASGGGYMIGGWNGPPPEPESPPPEPEPGSGPDPGGLGTTTMGLGGRDESGNPNC